MTGLRVTVSLSELPNASLWEMSESRPVAYQPELDGYASWTPPEPKPALAPELPKKNLPSLWLTAKQKSEELKTAIFKRLDGLHFPPTSAEFRPLPQPVADDSAPNEKSFGNQQHYELWKGVQQFISNGIGAALGGMALWHYRVIDEKFRGFFEFSPDHPIGKLFRKLFLGRDDGAELSDPAVRNAIEDRGLMADQASTYLRMLFCLPNAFMQLKFMRSAAFGTPLYFAALAEVIKTVSALFDKGLLQVALKLKAAGFPVLDLPGDLDFDAEKALTFSHLAVMVGSAAIFLRLPHVISQHARENSADPSKRETSGITMEFLTASTGSVANFIFSFNALYLLTKMSGVTPPDLAGWQNIFYPVILLGYTLCGATDFLMSPQASTPETTKAFFDVLRGTYIADPFIIYSAVALALVGNLVALSGQLGRYLKAVRSENATEIRLTRPLVFSALSMLVATPFISNPAHISTGLGFASLSALFYARHVQVKFNDYIQERLRATYEPTLRYLRKHLLALMLDYQADQALREWTKEGVLTSARLFAESDQDANNRPGLYSAFPKNETVLAKPLSTHLADFSKSLFSKFDPLLKTAEPALHFARTLAFPLLTSFYAIHSDEKMREHALNKLSA